MIMLRMNSEQQNPYQFIVDTDHSKRKPRMPVGNSKQSRIFIVAGGALALIVAAFVVMGLINSASNAGKADLVKVAQKQAELVRISELGMERSKGSSAKNLATTVNLSLQSDQTILVAALKTAGIKVSSKELALGKDQKTDTALTAAEQANKFDDVFIQTIQAELVEYQQSLKTAYDKASGNKLKQTLSDQYTTAGLLATAKQ